MILSCRFTGAEAVLNRVLMVWGVAELPDLYWTFTVGFPFVSICRDKQPAWQGDRNSTPSEPHTGLNASWGQLHAELQAWLLDLKTEKLNQMNENFRTSCKKKQTNQANRNGLSWYMMVTLPDRKGPSNGLRGAADEDHRQGEEHAEKNDSRTQLAGTVDWQGKSTHQNSSQNDSQNRQRHPDSSWDRDIQRFS